MGSITISCILTKLAQYGQLNGYRQNKVATAAYHGRHNVLCYIQELERYTEHLQKNHRHEMGIERARHKDTKQQLEDAQDQLNRLQLALKVSSKGRGNCEARKKTTTYS